MLKTLYPGGTDNTPLNVANNYKTITSTVAGSFTKQKEILDVIRKSDLADSYEYEDMSDEEILESGSRVYRHTFEEIECVLIEEKDNQYDPNALKLMIEDNCIGYLPKDDFTKYTDYLEKYKFVNAYVLIEGG